jgi:hypothetical protein
MMMMIRSTGLPGLWCLMVTTIANLNLLTFVMVTEITQYGQIIFFGHREEKCDLFFENYLALNHGSKMTVF